MWVVEKCRYMRSESGCMREESGVKLKKNKKGVRKGEAGNFGERRQRIMNV